jgi:N-acetyltransferase
MERVFVCEAPETSGECASLMQPEPIILTGRHVRLEPLSPAHAADLAEVGAEAEIWKYLPSSPPSSLAAVEAWIATALDEQARGLRLPFAIIDLRTGRAVGSTSYLDIAPAHRRMEIGWTWLGAPARRTFINTECKSLLLRHAFETLGCGRVQLKTDGRNLRSQTAILRIGAKLEGVLRQHMVLPDGHVRDTVMYSITAEEWPAVKARLASALQR